ncbi:MAG: ABC transporter permease [Gemmatimonadaceae bacterium]
MDTLVQDLRHALRALARNPGMAAVAVICLALGIGANATMFGVVDALMFKAPAHVTDPNGVVRIYFAYPGLPGGAAIRTPRAGYGTYEALRDHTPALEDVAAYWPTETSIGRGDNAHAVNVVLVTASFFRTLGTQPALGRFFAPNEERAEGSKTIVLGYELWKRRFDGDRGVLGRTVDVSGQPYTVIGVAPPEFTGIDLKRVDAWLPIGAATTMFAPNALSHENSFWLSTLGRLRHGASRDVAAAQATSAFVAENATYPMIKGARVEFAPLPVGRGPNVGANTKVSLWLGLVSLLVLLVACANVANLLLARAMARSREIAVRLSLGAGRWRIARQLLTESMVLALIGAAVALLLTAWTSAFVRSVVIPDVPLLGHAVSLRMLAFAGVVALGTGVVCGLAPAVVIARSDLNAVLKGESRGRSGRFLTQHALVGGQVALTVVLLAGAGLFVQSLRNIRAKDLGMDMTHVLYTTIDFRTGGVAAADANATYEQIVERVRQLPGVRAAGVSIGEAFRSGWGTSIIVPGVPASIPKQGDISPMGRAVSAGYFRATGTRIVAGRTFTAAEHQSAAHVVMISESLAHKYWPHSSPVGACVHVDDPKSEPCVTVVGVVANSPFYFVTSDPADQVFVPIESHDAGGHGERIDAMEIRTSGSPAAMIPTIRKAIWSVDPTVPFPVMQPLTDIVDPQYRPWQLGADMFGAFGLLALLLAAVGLYGVLAYAVVQQTRELGIRAALGAQPETLVRMVVTSGLTTAVIGASIGVAAALGAGRFIASLLYNVSAHDPKSLAAAAVSLVLVAGIASYLPARRAARVDPMEALRAE